jgi:septal ring factor EnvC (AmiA/AmiB activator)
MSGLVDRLTKLIREQEIAAAAERKRQQELAAARARAQAEARARALARAKEQQAERERLAREAAKHGKPYKPPAPVREEPQVAEETPETKPAPPPKSAETALAADLPSGTFESLRGRLTAPIAGTVAARFGAKRADGPVWRGMFFKAPEGTDVRAVGPGRVVHAQWMRGWGNMIIVNHGGEYLSIYGFNETLLKHVGDAVKAGEVIASAGSSGGSGESGLYFELRHLGKPIDPAGWVKF